MTQMVREGGGGKGRGWQNHNNKDKSGSYAGKTAHSIRMLPKEIIGAVCWPTMGGGGAHWSLM